MLNDFSFADNTIGYIIDGTMDKTVIIELRSKILNKFKSDKVLNLYLEDNHIKHFSLSAAIIGALFPLQHPSRFQKIALVTDRKWIYVIATINNSLLQAELKCFPTKNRISAISWIADTHSLK